MDSLPHDWFALLALAFTLGLKHGFDADHLATIDGLTRFNAGKRVARWCGFLFSLGHGMVVMAVAVGVGALARTWQVPQWVDDLGAWIAIGFLTALGVLNLAAVLSAKPHEVVRPVGLKGRLLGRFASTANPLLIALVGALFALSFDTMSQAALFALAGTQFGGVAHSALLGLLFMAGMMVTDGVNGLWIARLLRRADQLACVASRVMGLAVAGLSLLVAAHGVLKYFYPTVAGFGEGRELAFGLIVVAVLAISFLAATLLARTTASAQI
nr:nickel transporter [Rhodoferax sp.]